MASGDLPLQERIATASPIYALMHSSSDIVVHARLVEPLCDFSEVRVKAIQGRAPGQWNLVLAALDRPGLLAMFTGALVHEAIDVQSAVLASWDDGAALQALVVNSPKPPETGALKRSLEWSLTQGLYAPPVDRASVVFDQSDDTIYTSCEVTAPDRPGLLHAVAVAIANAGANIHAASVRTVDGIAKDLFDLSDGDNKKLEPRVSRAIEANLRNGFSGGG